MPTGEAENGAMTICIAVSEGGHLTEALFLESVFGAYDWFLVSYRCARIEGAPYRKYMVPIFPVNPLAILPTLWILFRAFLKERPAVVISTGSEIAIPAFAMAKLFRARTVFIETVTRFGNPTLTGRLLYPFSDKFYVQHPETLQAYGPRAEYHGAVV
jgi:UDP-N-acetylglucosamine:LPS N-acetylglucosamine transferase